MRTPHSVKDSLEHPTTYGLRQKIGAVLGPLLLLLTWLAPAPAGMSDDAWRTAGVAALMAVWWISESVPIPVTALLPIVLFPLGELAPIRSIMPAYADPIVFLFLGGFLLALAMERSGLHRRIAFGLIGIMGLKPRRIVAGFLIAAAFLSMWVSNTATALMMLPIALSVAALVPDEGEAANAARTFRVALLLAVAYGATTGGMGTLIGTPPNALLAGFMQRQYDVAIGFGQWMLVGVPVVLLALPVVYVVLTRVAFRVGSAPLEEVGKLIAHEKRRLGAFAGAERIVAIVFTLTALGWVSRRWLTEISPMISDTTIAIAGAVVLFMIPDPQRPGRFVMSWDAAKALPWDVLLLFGGGLCLAGRVQDSGLSAWLGEQAVGLGGLPLVLTVATVCFGILMLTELTSNTATAATFLPVIAAVAISLGQHPLLLLVPTALAANCSYMMPVGTPPNAIVFGSRAIPLPVMARTGLWLNLLLVPLIVGVIWLLGPYVFGVQIDVLPEWVAAAP
ncbi:SLC13 family permease [Actomonas aquatica]|uniref:DASS family sodium-coupled anion symporter n=1 Tax=Actomonas aquatica TaxID=2866162 RepID=A0ABZ1CBG2_9BACT|nr:DASS family sodium-coupled anion symporter [Opitutus sp. WL0086]WRQ88924.1 DASS family sodium-coupled anion symporter [Opitutus sp. WL0086]